MKKIEAVIRVETFEAVRADLERRGIGGLTVSEVMGFGHDPGHRGTYRGSTYQVDSHPRLRIEVVTTDAEAGPIAETIARAARTGRIGDGVVAIVPVDDAVRIRTAERGAVAVSQAGAGRERTHAGLGRPTPVGKASAR